MKKLKESLSTLLYITPIDQRIMYKIEMGQYRVATGVSMHHAKSITIPYDISLLYKALEYT